MLTILLNMDLKPPKALVTEGNLEHNWKTWKNELDLFMVATEASEKSSKIKSSILLHSIDPRAREINATFTFETEEGKTNLMNTVHQKRI